MNYEFIEKQAKDIFFTLYDSSTGDPITDIPASGLVVKYIKANEVDYTVKTITDGVGGNFVEIGEGLYKLNFTDTELDILGNFAVSILGTGVYTTVEPKQLIGEVKPPQYLPAPSPDVAVVFGNVKDLTGLPTEQPQAVRAQIVELPAVMAKNYISTKVIETYTDMDGMFKLRLVIGALVIVEIANTGYRRQFYVPDVTSINIADI